MAKANVKKKIQFWGTGRRKKAIARVRLIPAGTGTIVINDRTFEDYFPQGTLQYIVKQPLALLDMSGGRNPSRYRESVARSGRKQPSRA